MDTNKTIKGMTYGALFLMGIGIAQADTLSFTNSVAMPNDVNSTVSLGKFDSSLGTLTGVSIKLTTTVSGAQVSMDNDSNQAQTGTARVQNLVNSLVSGVTLLKTNFLSIESSALQLNASQIFNLDATSDDTVGQFNATGLGDYGIWSPGSLSAVGSGDINSLVWAGYTGTGTFDITINSTYTTSATFDGNDGYFQGNTPNGAFEGIVTYSYEAIPEPASIAMIGAIAGACIFVRRMFLI